MSNQPDRYVTEQRLGDALRTFSRGIATTIKDYVGSHASGSRVVVHAGQPTKRLVTGAKRDATTGEWSAQIVDTPIDDATPGTANASAADYVTRLEARVAALEDALGDLGSFKASHLGQGRQLSRHSEHLSNLENKIKKLHK